MAITPVFCCGAECGVNENPHFSGSGGQSFSTTTVRSGARSFRLNVVASNGQWVGPTLASTSTRVYRVYVRFATLPNAVVQIAGNAVGSPASGAWFNSADNKIYAGQGSGAFGATGISISTGIWYRLDIRHTSTTIDVQVDGVACGSFTGTIGNNTAMRLLGGINTYTTDVFFDDIIVSDTSADYPIGSGFVNHFVPTSDGTHNIAGTGDFQRTLTGTDILNTTTDAFTLVDDVPLDVGAGTDWINMVAPPNATDYVECIFGPAPGILTPKFAPRAVEVIAGIHQAATGTGNMEIRMNDNGTTNAMYSATAVAGVTIVTHKRKHYATAIAGGGPWTLKAGNGNFTDLRVRFGSPAAVDANPDQFFSGIMIEAEFPEVFTAWPVYADRFSDMTTVLKSGYLPPTR